MTDAGATDKGKNIVIFSEKVAVCERNAPWNRSKDG